MAVDHKVVSRRETSYPFRAYWICLCGVRMKATYMGHALFKEFAEHKEEVS